MGKRKSREGLIQPASRTAIEYAFFPDGMPESNDTPLNAAYLWWRALVERDRQTYEGVSYETAAWNGYKEVRAFVSTLALCQEISFAKERDDLAYAKLMPDPGVEGYATRDERLDDGFWLTLVETEGAWFVWSLSASPLRPNAHDIWAA